nr:hypothetical protein [Burkholderiales bacterium]
ANRILSLTERNEIGEVTPLTMQLPPVFSGTGQLVNKIDVLSEARLIVYSSLLVEVYNSGWIPLFTAPNVLNTFNLNGVLAASTGYLYVIEARDSLGDVWSRTGRHINTNISTDISVPGFAFMGFAGAGNLDETYVTYFIEACEEDQYIETRIDGYYTLTNLDTNETISICDTTDGVGNLQLPMLVTPFTSMRFTHSNGTANSCPSATNLAPLLIAETIEDLFFDLFFYCPTL